tara:strand:- start:12240 stop:12491 length:252 start_codon:yes stop_codon:yes gene_type:complete
MNNETVSYIEQNNKNNKKVPCTEYAEKIKELEKEKENLKKKILDIEDGINYLNKNSEHNWERKREQCLYGERYYQCKNCGLIQ